MLERLVPLLGLTAFVGIALLLSTNRRAAIRRWDLILWGFGLQFICALLVLRTETGQYLMRKFNDGFVAVVNVTQAGSGFLFNPLLDPSRFGFIVAFQVLPTIIFFSALMSLLYHFGILQVVVRALAWLMHKTMRTSGAETLSAAGNIFVGQTEAPLMVRPFLPRMTRSELMTVMTGGFATVAGGVMAAYVGMLDPHIPGIAGHLLAASLMSAPAALLFGKLMVPETETPETADSVRVHVERPSANAFDAITLGTREGLSLALNVGAMLLVFLAMIALVDLMLTAVGKGIWFSQPEWWSLRGLVGFVFAPVAWVMGVTDWNEALQVGRLLGVKMVTNEFVAYDDLARMLNTTTEAAPVLSDRARVIATYALCGFANFGSIGIQIGGLSLMAPERRVDLSQLALRAMIAGTLACNATACVAAILL